LDRGFRNPTGAAWIQVDKDGVWYQTEELYSAGLTNPQLARLLSDMRGQTNLEFSTMDSAQASDIKDLADLGEDFIPVSKESGETKMNYVRYKIQKFTERIKENRYFVHPACVNTIKEFQSYRWKTKSRMSATDISNPENPEKANDHIMDALADLNAMYLHFYEEEKIKPWANKIPGTYIKPAVEEIEEETSFVKDEPDTYWEFDV